MLRLKVNKFELPKGFRKDFGWEDYPSHSDRFPRDKDKRIDKALIWLVL